MAQRLPSLPLNAPMHLAGSRLSVPIYELSAILDAIHISHTVLHGARFVPASEKNPIDIASYGCLQFDVAVTIPAHRALRESVTNQPPSDLEVAVFSGNWTGHADALWKRLESSGPQPHLHEATGTHSLYWRTAGAHLSLYFEEYIEWIRAKAQYDKSRFNPIWNFARVVRNAVNHGGTINIDDKTATPVRWHKLEYGYEARGREISRDLDVGDLIILMLEMDAQLAEMGYPN